jgi:hypothetical protein
VVIELLFEGVGAAPPREPICILARHSDAATTTASEELEGPVLADCGRPLEQAHDIGDDFCHGPIASEKTIPIENPKS